MAGRKDQAIDMLRLIWALDHGLHVRSQHMARQLGITGPQRLVIRLVASGQATAPGQLAEQLVVHKSTVTGIVARLEQRGLLKRDQHAEDGRRFTLALTPAGRRLALSHPGTIEAAVQRVMARATAREVASARAFLCDLAAELVRVEPAEAVGRTGRPGRQGAAASSSRSRRRQAGE